jgi:hypothetical protein
MTHHTIRYQASDDTRKIPLPTLSLKKSKPYPTHGAYQQPATHPKTQHCTAQSPSQTMAGVAHSGQYLKDDSRRAITKTHAPNISPASHTTSQHPASWDTIYFQHRRCCVTAVCHMTPCVIERSHHDPHYLIHMARAGNS